MVPGEKPVVLLAEDDDALRSVWIVDDSPLEAELARRTLAPEFATRIFSDGSTLLEQIILAPAPDLLVLDWLMPGVTGVEVCKFLRAQKATSELPILLLTSQSQTHQVVEGLAAGANDYLIKPYAPDELVARVISQIRVKRMRERGLRAKEETAAALRQIELRYRALIDGLPDLLVVSIDGRVAFMNPLAVKVFADGNRARIIGKPLQSIVHPDDREVTMARLAEVIAGGTMPLLEPRLLRHDGSQFTVELSAQAVRLDGRPGVVAVARDISERRGIQDLLLVSERKAKTAVRSRDNVLAIVSHDLRNPLNAISLHLALLAWSGPLGERRKGRAQVDAIKRSARRLNRMVEDLLTATTIDAGRLSATLESESVASLFDDLTQDLEPQATEHGLKLVAGFAPELPPVRCDRGRVLQVFANLVGNALKVTPKGGTIGVGAGRDGDFVKFSVSDSGPGVGAEQIPLLFERYWRGDASGASGSGLGLYIVKAIVETHGGEVGVDSPAGQGASFWFTLPLASCRP